MMEAAQGDGKFVAHFERKPTPLTEGQVMGLRRLAPANQAGLHGDELQMGLVAEAAVGREHERALVDPWSASDFRGRDG